MRRSFVLVTGALVVLFLLASVGPELFLLPFTILVGWIPAGWRLWSALRVEPRQVAEIAAAFVILIYGTHRFCVWLRRCAATNKTWRWRWTLAAHAGLWLMLFAGFSVIALVHQTGWMLRSGEPWFTRSKRDVRIRERAQLSSIASALREITETNQWNAAAIEMAFWNSHREGPTRSRELFENHELLVFQTNGIATRLVVVARRLGSSMLVCTPQGVHVEPRTDLAKIIRASR